MGYNKNGGWGQQPYGPQPNNGYGGNNRQQKKRSGCKMGTGKNGALFIQGWNASKKGMTKLIASMKKQNNMCTNSKGDKIEIWVCNITQGLVSVTKTGFFNTRDGKLRIPDLNMVASPTANNGGYFGKSVFKR
ncbi:MAG: hypothetical protein ACK479_12235 [Fluviicola sp.]